VATECANARTRRAWLCFVDESGVKLTPPVRRTWAPRGQTPVLRHRYRRGKQLSMCGLVAYRPGQDNREEPATWMGFELLEGAYDTRRGIRVLDGLGHQLGHQPVTVIWDNLGAHHSGDLHAWAATPAVAGVGVPAVVRAGAGPRGGAVGCSYRCQVAWSAWKSARMAW
jgi:hypothetical protein